MLKWRLASRVLSDPQIPTRVMGKFYGITTREAKTYKEECWPITKTTHAKNEYSKYENVEIDVY